MSSVWNDRSQFCEVALFAWSFSFCSLQFTKKNYKCFLSALNLAIISQKLATGHEILPQGLLNFILKNQCYSQEFPEIPLSLPTIINSVRQQIAVWVFPRPPLMLLSLLSKRHKYTFVNRLFKYKWDNTVIIFQRWTLRSCISSLPQHACSRFRCSMNKTMRKCAWRMQWN